MIFKVDTVFFKDLSATLLILRISLALLQPSRLLKKRQFVSDFYFVGIRAGRRIGPGLGRALGHDVRRDLQAPALAGALTVALIAKGHIAPRAQAA